MLFKKKEVVAAPPLLQTKNIILNCEAKPKEEVIRELGALLVESGHINPDYIDGMLKREDVFATNIGNGIAIPHSVEEGKKEVIHSGIAIMVFPNGTPWNDEDVRLVIGIAGKGDEHLDILANVAMRLGTPEAMDNIVTCDQNAIYDIFVGED